MNNNATLCSGLEAIAAEVVPGRLQRTLNKTAQQLREGKSLADIEKSPGVAAELVAIARAGKSSSTIEQTLQSVMAYSREQLYSRPRLPLTATYALLVLAFAAIIYFALVAFVVPVFEEIFWDLDVPLPRATAILCAQARFVTAHPWLCATLLVLFMLAAGIAVRRLPRWLSGTGYGFSIPLIGPWLKYNALARFSRLVATLLRSGLDLPEVLRRSGQATGDDGLEGPAVQLAQEIEDGKGFDDLNPDIRLPKAFLLIASHRDNHAMNAELFEALGKMYQARSTDQMAIFNAVFAPFVVVVVGLLVLFIVSALYGPLISLIQTLS